MRIAFLLVLLSVSFTFAQAEECIFDLSTQTDDFLKEKGVFKDYTWDDDKKVATIILESGDILKAQRGGCVHFAMSGELILNGSVSSIENMDYWLEKATWIAKNLFSKADSEHLENQLATKEYQAHTDSDSMYIFIPHESYIEYSIAVRKENGATYVYVGYYF